MSDLDCELQSKIFLITLSRLDKCNAFDEELIRGLQQKFDEAIENPAVQLILLRANGKDFCAGADLEWMQRVSAFTLEENIADAELLARLMHTIYACPKPTIAAVQGACFGGGIGLVAACDIAIATNSALFCFSEVKLGLIPAVISPYIVEAIGARAAKWLFMSAEVFSGLRAKELGLVQHLVADEDLASWSIAYAETLTTLAPEAILESKALVRFVQSKVIDQDLIETTAALIAKKRISPEGQRGLKAFLKKEKPIWD